MRITRTLMAVLLTAVAAFSQTSQHHGRSVPDADRCGPKRIIKVNFAEFASIPDLNGQAARMMLLIDEPGTRRIFVNDMQGPLYSVSYDGKTVTPYLDINAPNWGVAVQSQGNERGFQSFAFHPQFSQAGTRGFGKFYTCTDTTQRRRRRPTSRRSAARQHARHRPARVDRQDALRRDLRRRCAARADPVASNRSPTTTPGISPSIRSPRRAAPTSGCSTSGSADGGSGGDPLNLAQNLELGVRQDPAHRPARHQQRERQVRHSRHQPLRERREPDDARRNLRVRPCAIRSASPGTRRHGNMFVADIGQNIVEEISLVTAGANLGGTSGKAASRTSAATGRPRQSARRAKDHLSGGRVSGRPIRCSSPAPPSPMGTCIPTDGHPSADRRCAFGDSERRDLYKRLLPRVGRSRSAGCFTAHNVVQHHSSSCPGYPAWEAALANFSRI